MEGKLYSLSAVMMLFLFHIKAYSELENHSPLENKYTPSAPGYMSPCWQAGVVPLGAWPGTLTAKGFMISSTINTVK